MRYRLGVGPFVLTQSVMEQNSQLRLITKEMHKVADICSAVCQLGVLDGQFVLYLAKIEAPQAGPTVSYVGKHIYATCTALGKALLCDSAPEDIRALYPGSLPQYVSASIRDYAKLQQELEDTRVKGFAFDKGECDPNTYCMAAPLRNREKIVAAVSVSVGNAKEFQEKKKIMTDSLTKARGNIELILNSNPEFMLFLP
jgi:DNA-binding IclR family transcriptional regulator